MFVAISDPKLVFVISKLLKYAIVISVSLFFKADDYHKSQSSLGCHDLLIPMLFSTQCDLFSSL